MLSSLLKRVSPFMPAVALAALLVWGWHGLRLDRAIPHYGDTLEFMWVLSWYADAIPQGHSISVYPLAFYPAGWQYAENLVMLLAMLPLVWLKGPAFAYNVTVLATFVASFAGGYLLARRYVERLPSTVAALLMTFAGVRWFHQLGHVNIMIGSALIPWVLLALDRALATQGKRVTLLVAAGVLWAAAMSGSMYFAFLTGLAVVAWAGGMLLAGRVTWRAGLTAILLAAGVALLLSLPGIIWLWKNSSATGVGFYAPGEVNFWGASLNALPLPSIDHPWFGATVRTLYRGVPFEQGAVNLGLLASLLAVVGGVHAWRVPRWRPVLVLAISGVVLSLGLTLKWDNVSVQAGWLRPLNTVLWHLGHAVKPSFFASAQPPAPFDAAVPLPGLLVAALVPFAERARVFGRFALAGSVGVYLLAALAVARMRPRWVGFVLALLLVLEVLPAPLQGRPLPPLPHPAFTWLAQQEIPGQSIADIVAAHPYTPVLLNEGESVYATRIHGKPAVAGASSIWPAHTAFLFQWLATHQHAMLHPHLAPLLRAYGVRYVLLHERGELEPDLLEESRQNPALRLVQCFDPPPDKGPWSYPICVLEVLPAANEGLNLLFGEGWSGAESWGIWAEGTSSRAEWVATRGGEARLTIEAFPVCAPDRPQQASVELNGQVIAEHEWTACEPWAGQFALPSGLVWVGSNDLLLRSRFAIRPSELSGGTAPDTRELSVGFSKLYAETIAP